MTQDTRDKLIEAVASVRANLESADRVAPDGAIVVVEDREALRTIINALPGEDRLVEAIRTALCGLSQMEEMRIRAAISTLCVGGK
jgi:hypothetical protein